MSSVQQRLRCGFLVRLGAELLTAIGVLSAVVLAIIFLWFSLISAQLPEPEVLGQRIAGGGTQLYDRAGKILLFEVGTRRSWVDYANIPERAILATLAAEDAGFFYHRGVSPRGIVRAIWLNLRSGSVGYGGSTITQQLARNLFLDNRKSVSRKVREVLLAVDLERRYSKEEILTFYLNTINFGEGNYGLKTAANFYLGKELKDLTWAEMASLISIPRSPLYYAPTKKENLNRLIARRNQILGNLRQLGWINEQTEQRALAEQFQLTGKRYARIAAPHFVLEVRTILQHMFPGRDLDRAGLTVVTTLDFSLQQIAEQAVSRGAAENEKRYGGRNASLLAVDARTGEIIAMVGSRDFSDSSIDGQVNMTIWPRQPGSAFKPFSYLTLFQLGYPLETILFDLPTNFGTPAQPYRPGNFDQRFLGPISLTRALAESRNVPAVKVFYLAGTNRVIANAQRAGITTLSDSAYYGLSLGLGTAELRMLDLVRAYGTLANDGELISQTFIRQITDATGKVLYRYQPTRARVIDSQSVRMVNTILKDPDARRGLFASSLRLTRVDDREIAIKTGTSQEYRDAWVFGYTPTHVVAVWSGNSDGRPMRPGGASLVAALPIWHEFTVAALRDAPRLDFPLPLPRQITKPLLNGQWRSAEGVHDVLYYVDRSNPTGSAPNDPSDDPQFNAWEESVQAWLSETEFDE